MNWAVGSEIDVDPKAKAATRVREHHGTVGIDRSKVVKKK
jgi:hypothetical protein